jgi:hypothetical protein
MKRMRQLEFLVFKRGGVAGAIRRLVNRWKGLFSSSVLREALARKYPLLEPAPSQIQDTLEWMEHCRKIRCVMVSAWEKLYQRAPQQLWFKFS